MLYPSQRNRNVWRRQLLSGCLWVYKVQQWLSLELGENLKKPRLPRKKLTVLKKKKSQGMLVHILHIFPADLRMGLLISMDRWVISEMKLSRDHLICSSTLQRVAQRPLLIFSPCVYHSGVSCNSSSHDNTTLLWPGGGHWRPLKDPLHVMFHFFCKSSSEGVWFHFKGVEQRNQVTAFLSGTF